jgi:hypothetical protein
VLFAPLYQPGGIFAGTNAVDPVASNSVMLSHSGTATQVTVVVSGPDVTVWADTGG